MKEESKKIFWGEIEDAKNKQKSLSKITDEDFMDLYGELKLFGKGINVFDVSIGDNNEK